MTGRSMDALASAAAPRRAYWLKTLHQWHWISSALCLVGMLLFALTGITLNNARHIEAKPAIVARTLALPPAERAVLSGNGTPTDDKASAALPASVQSWLEAQLRIEVPPASEAEWSAEEIYLSLPRPGGDAWLRIDRASGEIEYERTDRGWISYFNDLHKGRHTGAAWSWFLDIFSVACLIFSITGLLILKMHAANRASTWPLVGMGLVAPLLLALLLIH